MENKTEIIAKPKKFTSNIDYYYSRKHEVVTCDICGKSVFYFGLSRHRSSKYHIKAKALTENKVKEVLHNNTVDDVAELIKAKLVHEINELTNLKNQLLELKDKKIIPRKQRVKKDIVPINDKDIEVYENFVDHK
jgi:hypothetical protein